MHKIWFALNIKALHVQTIKEFIINVVNVYKSAFVVQ